MAFDGKCLSSSHPGAAERWGERRRRARRRTIELKIYSKMSKKCDNVKFILIFYPANKQHCLLNVLLGFVVF